MVERGDSLSPSMYRCMQIDFSTELDKRLFLNRRQTVPVSSIVPVHTSICSKMSDPGTIP